MNDPHDDSNRKVFLSHSREAVDLASRLGVYLSKNNCRPLRLTEDSGPGASWREALGETIAEADGVVLIVDPEPSEYLRAEWSAALQACWEERDKRLVPVLRPGAEVPPFLRNAPIVRFEEGEEDKVFDRVLDLLRNEEAGAAVEGPDTHIQLLQRLDVAIDALSEEEPDTDELREHRRQLEADCKQATDPTVIAGINLGVGLISLELGEPEQAIQELGEALRLGTEEQGSFPDRGMVLTSLAYAHAALDQLPEAIDAQQRAVEGREGADPEDPGLATFRQRLGVLFLRAERYEEAREALAAALPSNREQFGPEHPRVQANEFFLAHALEQLGEMEEARQHYEIALETTDLSAQARGVQFLGLGRTLTTLGEFAEARQVLSRGLDWASAASDVEPGFVASLALALGAVCLRSGDPSDAAEAFELSLAQYREACDEEGIANSLYSLAHARRQAGQLDGAKKAAEEALEHLAGNPPGRLLTELIYELAKIAKKSGDLEHAREAFEQAYSAAVEVWGETDPRVGKFARALGQLDHDVTPTS